MYEGFSKNDIVKLQSRELIYVKNFDRFITDVNIPSDLFSLIRNHKFDNFKVIDKSYCTEIIPDIHFLNLIDKLNVYLESDKIDLNNITLFVTKDLDNLIDFETGIPNILKGCSVGYKLYKVLVDHYGWISSDKRSTNDAINLWYNLLQDVDMYCVTSNYFSYIIKKTLHDIELKKVLENIKKRKEIAFNDIQFDDDIKEKITKMYGSFENYKTSI
jgi:hypothetical protein